MTARASLLLVDDEARVLEALRRRLRSFRDEWDVAFAASGAEALAALESRPFDFLVTDMRMPAVDGAELLRRVRERWPRTARVVLSGQTDFDAAMRSVTLAHQFLGKPCAPEALLGAVAAMRDALAWVEAPGARDAIVALTTLPCSPDASRDLDAILASADASAETAADIVSRDAAMAAKVLQVACSPFFGVRAPSADPREAARTLGASVLRVLAKHAFSLDAWPADVEPRGDFPERVGAIVRALVPAASSLATAPLGATVLRLWGVRA